MVMNDKMKTEDNYIINEDFTDKEGDYYVIFRTPGDIVQEINHVEIIQLKRNSGDSVELKIRHNGGRWMVYHYVNELIGLLDKFDIGFR